ncbi:MAG: hypothetical protein DDT42_02160 [candidate division WS2 bacterium]|uniref:Secretion system C-terminal sorting domain-containing protein n=1 Tax=Psychracetigena formicireducens TaxID=2986056 RepID=A0A9E2F850_PSYF1|nr:hypothetical protein [Candidatus Psychracetigena formicireducens]
MTGGALAPGANQFFMSGWLELKGNESISFKHRISRAVTGTVVLSVRLQSINETFESPIYTYNYTTQGNNASIVTVNNISFNGAIGFYRIQWLVQQSVGSNTGVVASIDDITSTIDAGPTGRSKYIADLSVVLEGSNKGVYENAEQFERTFRFRNNGPNNVETAVYQLNLGSQTVVSRSFSGSNITYDESTGKLTLTNFSSQTERSITFVQRAENSGDFQSGAVLSSASGNNFQEIESSNNSATRSFSVNGPLPVKLVSFVAKVEETAIKLNWTTSAEYNSDYYQIERLTSNNNYEILGSVKAAGFSNKLLQYEFIDQEPLSGNSTYRIKQVDFDGKFEYFSTSANLLKEIAIEAYPNPTVNWLHIVASEDLTNTFFSLSSAKGELQNADFSINYSTAKVDVSNLPQGVYFLTIRGLYLNKVLRIVKN